MVMKDVSRGVNAIQAMIKMPETASTAKHEGHDRFRTCPSPPSPSLAVRRRLRFIITAARE